ncbi:mycofactocin system GMC family oxidoreductase MftG [Citricoccus sp. SGAir0253]|uniref:mycofactocin dehydrogenase MftG n=1 Tax=Citricoccus sp. SGAir0253 TaxID=2567881 RepID=UPI0010CCE114|nr:mycofactocin system GMC family oxidoreductase MftG [Citricoccus sp. SGAir0253]QCU78895.1 mycofactocin system GMC family oxidoreductase MftG [Citricoccus sp. SGAir0253]
MRAGLPVTAPDVLVVGAGGAGAPFAARLSEDPGCTVLVLEAGPVPRTAAGLPPEVRCATVLPTVRGPGPYTWWHRAEVAPGRTHDVGRGQGAGGSTSVNGAYFVRPRADDLRRWAEAGNPAWEPEAVLPLLAAAERDVQFGGRPGHGDAGPVPVDRRAFPESPLAAAFGAAAEALGHPVLDDLNDITAQHGHGELPLNVHEGTRMSTALAYLFPALDRPNLTVLGGANVLRVVLRDGRACGVEAVIDGTLHRVHAGQVVLAAGPVRSAHLLMLSGIGPAPALAEAGVDTVVDSPGVGATVSDHPDIVLSAPLARPLRPGPADPLFAWALNWTASGSTAPGDLEVLPMLRPFPVLAGHPAGAELPVIVALQRPEGRGTLALDPADPQRPPRVRYRHLCAAEDRRRMREGVRTAADLLSSTALADWVDAAAWDRRVFDDDRGLDEWMTAHLGTAVHLAGTAPMGPGNRPGTVTDQWGRVHGVDRLRVVDTAILPDVPSRGPAATAVLLGELIAARVRGLPPHGCPSPRDTGRP